LPKASYVDVSDVGKGELRCPKLIRDKFKKKYLDK